MKQLAAILFLTGILFNATPALCKSPVIYPDILKYFEHLDKEKRKSENLSALETLKYNIGLSNTDSIVFVCSGNSFRSQALLVFCQTMLATRKSHKIQAYSCGYNTTAIDERLISFLKLIGYKVEAARENDADIYLVKYSDDRPAIKLYPKTIPCPKNTLSPL